MLSVPSKDFHRSINAHNINLGTCCDWIEASALFVDGEVAGSDIVDLLREGEIYESQDFAWELVTDVFNNIRERDRSMGDGYPIQLTDTNRISRKDDWREFPAYSFCLALSLVPSYPNWAKSFGKDHTEQGELFEGLTAESVRSSLIGWTVHPTGWARTAPNRLGPLVAEIAQMLGEVTGDIVRWTKATAKDAGLDLLCFRPFPDGRVGIPVYLCQCASGQDWKQKLKAPDLRVWTKVIPFASDPKKAFAMPYFLSSSDFVQHCNVVDGLLIDRQRLLAPSHRNRNWLSQGLAEKLRAWTNLRIAKLPIVGETRDGTQ